MHAREREREAGMDYLGVAAIVLTLLLISKLCDAIKSLLWRPYILTKYFKKQGITGPPYSILSGSLDEIKTLKKAAREVVMYTTSHDIVPRVLPHYHKWSSQYGDMYLYWFGLSPRIYVAEPHLAKEILSNKFGFYSKPETRPSVTTMVGKGLALINGLDWAKHRRIVNPAFNVDKLKAMIRTIAACTLSVTNEWNVRVNQAENQCTKIEMNREFQELTGDIIAHTAFRSSYIKGKEVFEAQQELQQYCAARSADIFIPGSQYFPTPSNVRMWRLDRKVKNALRCIIKSRLDSKVLKGSDSSYGDDLLGLMIEASETARKQLRPILNMDEIMEECKTFFFAGHETTSNLLTWTMFLLSSHQEWQERLRNEVLKECGTEIPDADMLTKLKLVTMVLLEALRLYCPVIMVLRKASEDMNLGNLMIPKETCISIPLVVIHREKKYWGEDANKFNPLRFADGISKAAKHPNALLPFSMGPRACIGQNFAMLEAKTVIAMILQRFSFSLSPEYRHTPVDNLTLKPQHGLPILLRPLNI